MKSGTLRDWAVMFLILASVGFAYYFLAHRPSVQEPTSARDATLTIAANDSHVLTPTMSARPTSSTAATLTPTLTNTPIITVSPTLTPTLLPAVLLEEPEDHASVACQPEVKFRWSWPHTLTDGDYYKLKMRWQEKLFEYDATENQCCLADVLPVADPLPGEYDWTVAVMRSSSPQAVSEEADWNSFKILPIPVVHSVSPTCTVEGAAGVTVTVSGKDFMHPLTLTIGVPLQAALVNSSTITATLPMTLGNGKYDVIVMDSVGQGNKHASFTVSEPPPTRMPVTPLPVYPKPVLDGLDIHGDGITFHWSWDGQLADADHFALRVGIGTAGKSKRWTKDTQLSWRFTEQGDYVWEVAICRGDPADRDCSGNKQLVVSDRGTFSFVPPPPPRNTPEPP